MSTEAALLRAIRDMPDEDTPRLVYADYLDEDGYSPRAEFIRVQIERSQLPDRDPRRVPLEDRAHDLLAEHERAWLGVAPDDADGLTEWEFDRGFVHEVAASPVFMRTAGTDLCAAHPVRRWRVQSGEGDTVADLRDAGQRGWFSRLEALDLSGCYADLGELGGFLAHSNFDRLRELDLTGRGPLDPLPELLEFAPFRDRLKVLRCGDEGTGVGGRLDAQELVRALGNRCRLEELAVTWAVMTADDLRDLLAADVCSQLASFHLHANHIAPDGWAAFRAARCRLIELDLSHSPLGGISLDRVLDCASLSDLRRLHISGCDGTTANARELAASRFWAQAEELRMQRMMWNGTGEDEPPPEAINGGLAPLFRATGPSNLRVLDIAGNSLHDGGVGRLCSAPWAGSLAYLDLSQNFLSDEALRTIAASGRFKNLRTLHLNFNSPYPVTTVGAHESITDAGLRALADCPDLANLRVLSVSGTRITAAGVDAVLNSPHWRLTGLMLAQCQLRADVVNVLASSPRLARLEVLDLSGNDEIDLDDLGPLAESEYLSPQTELDIRGIGGRRPSALYPFRLRLGRRLSE